MKNGTTYVLNAIVTSAVRPVSLHRYLRGSDKLQILTINIRIARNFVWRGINVETEMQKILR